MKAFDYVCDGQLTLFDYFDDRKAGEMTTLDTRGDAHETVDKKKRYAQIIECLKECPMTAKETAIMMMRKGYIPTSERNFTAPRLTVAVYALRDGQMDIFD